MASDPRAVAALALHRFGLGPRRNSIAAIAGDPRGALLAELNRPDAGRVDATGLMTSGEAARAVFDFRAERQARLKRETRDKKEAAAQGMAEGGEAMAANADGAPDKPDTAAPAKPELPRQIFLAEAQARIDAARGAEIGFVERLVWFWSNHFCISADKILSMAGAYEREAIRPYVLGRFADMLAAVESHPAMLFYLDNAGSIGPNSVAGINRDKGLNENLAREILELHTLGVRTGYTQEDVTRFANVLTGWTWLPLAANPDHGGEFTFNKRMHEPGEQIVVGRRYADTGVEQGRTVLADLAREPATARHIAHKLVRHFVADAPPSALVDKLAKKFRDTDGDLKQLAATLVAAPEAWAPERNKLKPPSEWIVGVLRLTGATPPIAPVVGAQTLLGEPLWRPPAPKGFADDSAAWIGGLAQRLDIANRSAGQLGDDSDPLTLLDVGLGPLASNETRESVALAGSRQQAVALLLMAPRISAPVTLRAAAARYSAACTSAASMKPPDWRRHSAA